MITGRLRIGGVLGELNPNGITGRIILFDMSARTENFYASDGIFTDADGNEIMVQIWRT